MVTKSDKAVLVYFPSEVVEAMDRAARASDTDRSKWIRNAARDALRRRGIDLPQAS